MKQVLDVKLTLDKVLRDKYQAEETLPPNPLDSRRFPMIGVQLSLIETSSNNKQTKDKKEQEENTKGIQEGKLTQESLRHQQEVSLKYYVGIMLVLASLSRNCLHLKMHPGPNGF